MQASKALEVIKHYEGLELAPYICPGNVVTIGYGTTVYPNGEAVKMTDEPITPKYAEECLAFYVKSFEKQVLAFLHAKNISLINDELSALVSFSYNLGLGPLKEQNRSLHQAMLTKDREQIAKAMLLYCKAGGKRLEGLVRRRETEAHLFLTGSVIFDNFI